MTAPPSPFLGDPEDALFARCRCATPSRPNPGQARPCAIRIGVNLGPVRLVKDLNGQLNIIGDGINVAQRVMSFAQPGQLLVSRSYLRSGLAACRSTTRSLFRYEGARTDKHVREHEVYSKSGRPAPT